MTMRQPITTLLLGTLLASGFFITTHAFVPCLGRPAFLFGSKSPVCKIMANKKSGGSGDTGEVGSGSNWIERSFPVDIGGIDENSAEALKKVEDYSLGISGVSFQTGPLSRRMFDAIMANNGGPGKMSSEIKKAFTLYAMDFTAKEATKAALKQNGLQMALEGEDMEDEGMWGDVDSIQLLDMDTNEPIGQLYDSTDDAIEDWTPGQGFNFVVRQVPAKIRELSLDELLQALDPDGELREQAEAANWTLPDEDINSLQDLANDSIRRSQYVPREAESEKDAFRGLDKRGYRVIFRSALSRDSVNADGSENTKTLMHVMDALVSHGALVVDLTDGGTTYKQALHLAKMWNTTQNFFNSLDSDWSISLPGMTSVMESSQAAKVGYASYDNGSMQFLETRLERMTGELLPIEARPLLGEGGSEALRMAFDTVCEVGKDVVRITTAAGSVEAGAFDDAEEGPSISGLSFMDENSNDGDGDMRASLAATLMVDELVDNGKPLPVESNNIVAQAESSISMSPHRICRYRDLSDKKVDDDKEVSPREVFGAHTDSSFITAVPVAAVSGLEVYDEEQERWYRPELAARKHWENERVKRGQDDGFYETIKSLDETEEDVQLPWHARYVVIMAGEFLQIATRNEVPAAVHRVVAEKDGPVRLSAPILLRGRPGTKMDVARYLGAADNSLLQECDGMSMDEIHAAMQPSSFQ